MRPLEGIRILDLTQAYSGPFCTMHLADHGAEVIKIERPRTGDQTRTWGPMRGGESGFHAYINRNKSGITLDLKSEKGREIFAKLIATADVVVENYKVGILEGLGFSYERMKEINPKIIYGNITGFGLEGPLASRPCYDIVGQAMGGLMCMTGFPDQPATKVGPAIADNYSGAFLCMGILMALYRRTQTGEGCHIDVAMIDSMVAILEHFIIDYTIGGENPKRSGNIEQSIAPFDSFRAKDGEFVLACGTDAMFKRLCEVMDRMDIFEDERCRTNYLRCQNYLTYLKPEMEKWTMTKTLEELEEIIVGIAIPFGVIQDIQQVVDHPQTRQRNMLWEVDSPGMGKIEIPGTPIKFDDEEDVVSKPAPVLGESNHKILTSLGYSDTDIEMFSNEGVI